MDKRLLIDSYPICSYKLCKITVCGSDVRRPPRVRTWALSLLLYNDDLTENLTTSIRLYTVDCVIYRRNNNDNDPFLLQIGLDRSAMV